MFRRWISTQIGLRIGVMLIFSIINNTIISNLHAMIGRLPQFPTYISQVHLNTWVLQLRENKLVILQKSR